MITKNNIEMNRALCCLPSTLKGLCEMGCIYREKAFKHLACRSGVRSKQVCVSPCATFDEDCVCRNTKTKIRMLTKKERNEVFLL